MDEKIISHNIKKLRAQKKLTLQSLAKRTGLTKGYLSKVERSEKAPPYSTLTRIAGALGVEVTSMLSKNMGLPADIRLCLSRGKERPVIKGSSQFPGYDYEVLAEHKPGKNMEPFIIHSPREITQMYAHEGEEFMFIMNGSLEFVYGDDTYVLEKGDNVYFDACVPHAGRSVGDDIATVLVVIYFYKRNRQ
jgi:transcriptional regulator with XRE-family HTH domain